MRDRGGWRFPTNPNSKHPSAEQTRLAARQETVGRSLEEWRSERAGRPPGSDRDRGRLGLVLRALGVALLLALVALAAMGWLLRNAYESRIYPQVVAGDLAVGSLTREQAVAAIERRLAPIRERPVTLRLGDSTWRPSAEEIGLEVDPEQTVDRALRAGRDQGAVRAVVGAALGRQRPVTVPYVARLDGRQLDRYLEDVGEQVTRDPVNPRVRVEGDSVTVEGGGTGLAFLPRETRREVTEALRTLSDRPVEVRVLSSQGAVGSEEVSRAERLARTVVSAPLTLEAEGRRFEITTRQLAEWVRSEVTGAQDEGSALTVRLDPVSLERYLEGVARELDEPARDARLAWNAGALQVLSPGRSGRELDRREAIGAVQRAAAGEDRTVQLPLRNLAPRVSESALGSLGIVGFVVTGESSLRESLPERAVNIRAAARAATGVVVLPGEEFSFAAAVGAVGEERGYQPEPVGEEQRGLMGPRTGLSQVSTTVYRAALLAGLPIQERYASPERVWQLEQGGQRVGTDAVVSLPEQDLRFLNNTSAALLVQIVSSEDVLRVELYGARPDWTVELGQPEIENAGGPGGEVVWRDRERPAGERLVLAPPLPGGEVRVRRVVRRGSEVLRDESVFSAYAPSPRIVLEGSGTGEGTPTATPP